MQEQGPKAAEGQEMEEASGWKPLTASHLRREKPLPPGGSGSRPLSCRQDPSDLRRKGLGRPGWLLDT